jgi:hypothetical protein
MEIFLYVIIFLVCVVGAVGIVGIWNQSDKNNSVVPPRPPSPIGQGYQPKIDKPLGTPLAGGSAVRQHFPSIKIIVQGSPIPSDMKELAEEFPSFFDFFVNGKKVDYTPGMEYDGLMFKKRPV